MRAMVFYTRRQLLFIYCLLVFEFKSQIKYSNVQCLMEKAYNLFYCTGEVYTVVCSPHDASLVATRGQDDRGFLWKIGEKYWAQELKGHTDSVSSLAFSTDGRLLASGSFDGNIHVWDVTSGTASLKCTIEGPKEGIEWVKWHPREHIVLAGSADSNVWMWNADTSTYLSMFSGHIDNVTCGDFTPDGNTVCTGSDDASLRIWNLNGGNMHVIKVVSAYGPRLSIKLVLEASARNQLTFTVEVSYNEKESTTDSDDVDKANSD
ncbi:hypothetical protein GIB67_038445 [Kingdonia uniflora]|uniref:Uncharacterized protein n=1 Tax=Kingdonia uniflora TaxID=39325 RepID=A0A7J7NPU2_9MAGN|nr:hypothetical protein GIB67_038445 [Kingdonia uniflora]